MNKRYEYQITDLTRGELLTVMNAVGGEGWRLVAVDNFRFYWEKELPPLKEKTVIRAPKTQQL